MTLSCNAVIAQAERADCLPKRKDRSHAKKDHEKATTRQVPRAPLAPQPTVTTLVKTYAVDTAAGPIAVDHIWERCRGGILKMKVLVRCAAAG